MATKVFVVALLLVGTAFALSSHDLSRFSHLASKHVAGFPVRQAALVEVMNKIRDKAPIDELRKILGTINAHIADELKVTRKKLIDLENTCKARSTSLLADTAKVKKQLEAIRAEVATFQSKLEAENVDLAHTNGLINADRDSANKQEVELAHLDQEKEDSQLTYEQKIAELKSFLEALYDIKAVVLSSVLIKRSDKNPSGPSKLETGVDRNAQSVPQPSTRDVPVAPKPVLSADEKGLGEASAELLEKDTHDSAASQQVKALLLSLSERIAPEHRETLDLARSLIESGAPIDDLVTMIEKLIHQVETDIKDLRASHAAHITSVGKQAQQTQKLIEAMLRDLQNLKSRGNALKSEISAIADKMVALSLELKARIKEIRLLKAQYRQNEFDCSAQQHALKKDIESLLEEQQVLANLSAMIEKKIGSSSMYVKKRIGQVTLSYSYAIAAWAPCTVTCGKGTQSRSIHCTSFSGDVVDEKNCANFTRPRAVQECISKECPIDCVLSEWRKLTECSTSCGAGTYTELREVITPAAGGRPCGEITKSLPCDNPSCGALAPPNAFETGKHSLAAVGHAYIALDSRNPTNHVLKFSGCSSRIVDAISGKFVHSQSGKYRISFDYRAMSANLKKPTDGLTVGLVDQDHNYIVLATRDHSIPSAVYHFGNVPEMDRDGDFVRVTFTFDALTSTTGRYFPHRQSAHPVEMSKTPVAVFLSENNTSGAGCGQVEVDNISIEEIHN